MTTMQFDVPASEKYVSTRYAVVADQRYVITSEGTWHDSYIETDASGYSRWYLRPFVRLRRVPSANWFSLIGQIGPDTSTRIDLGRCIAHDQPFVAPKSGELLLFANDVRWMYGNNRGSVTVRISTQT